MKIIYGHKNQGHRDRNKRYRQNHPYERKPAVFIGVDGEGVNTPDEHKYVLLGVGDCQVENPDGLSWKEIFSFLYSSYQRFPAAVFAGFYLGYDFTQWLKTLPEDRARILLTDKGIQQRSRTKSGDNHKPFPVRFEGWEFDTIPGKRFQLRPLICKCDETPEVKCEHKRPGWMYINDAGSFWQTSFLNAINPLKWDDPICSLTEYETVKAGKEHRSNACLDDNMRDYNILENIIFARAMQRLDAGFRKIGIFLAKDQWFGPGQASAVWLRCNHVPRRKDAEENIPDWYLEAARMSYIAGWFEIPCHGIIPGISHEYDINSAYPFITSELPCMLHGKYSRSENLSVPENEITIVRCRVKGSNPYVGTLLNRSKERTIRRPWETSGWYWLHEIKAASECGLIDETEIYEWVSYLPCDCSSPCRGIRELYEERLKVGKDTALGKACKLVYNSIYGKFAQSIAAAPYGNWAYASLITAGCRIKILNAIASHPDGVKAVAMIATDAIFFLSEHTGIPVSEKLGEWGYKKRSNLTLFKPGVYWDDSSREGIVKAFKSRGVSARDFFPNIPKIDEMFLEWFDGFPPGFKILLANHDVEWASEKKWPEITFKMGFSMVTCRQALQRGTWKDAGQTGEAEVTHSSRPWDKRARFYHDTERNVFRTRPLILSNIESVPYQKRYGSDDPWSLENLESMGTTMEGLVSDEINDIRRQLSGEE